MKKIIKIFLSLIFVISFSLIFFGCKKETIVLITPTSVAIVNNGILEEKELDKNNLEEKREYLTNNYLLVTDENINATKYRFFITDHGDYENLNNYVSIDSEKNYLDINSFFNSKKEYHFFVQYIGSGSYQNSAYSVIKKYIPQRTKVDIPYLQMLDTNLYWFKIMNANSYEVYETVLDKDDQVVTPEVKIATLEANVFEYDFSSRVQAETTPYYKYQYKVKALANGYYANSDLSNSTEYIKTVVLDAPTNLKVKEIEGSHKLTWNSTKYTTKYKVLINETTEIETESNELDITSYLKEYATYSFKVKSINSEVLDYSASEYSNSLNYNHTMNLDAPTNLTAARNGEYLTISFDEINLAQSYTLIIKHNGVTLYNEELLVVNSAMIEIQSLFGSLNSDKEIEISVRANKVNEYILGSETSTITYTVLKVAE